MNLTLAQQQALGAWYLAAEAAKPAKLLIEAEQAARKAACAALAPLLPDTDGEGTAYADLPEGWRLKRAISYSRKIDVKVVESLRAPLKALHQSLDKLVDWKPSLITKEYRELTAEARAIFDTCLTTTPGLPTLELVPPKVQP
jgi:hypothetical protein